MPVKRDEGLLGRTMLQLLKHIQMKDDDADGCATLFDDLDILELQLCRGMPFPLPYAELVQLGAAEDACFFNETSQDIYMAKESVGMSRGRKGSKDWAWAEELDAAAVAADASA